MNLFLPSCFIPVSRVSNCQNMMRPKKENSTWPLKWLILLSTVLLSYCGKSVFSPTEPCLIATPTINLQAFLFVMILLWVQFYERLVGNLKFDNRAYHATFRVIHFFSLKNETPLVLVPFYIIITAFEQFV